MDGDFWSESCGSPRGTAGPGNEAGYSLGSASCHTEEQKIVPILAPESPFFGSEKRRELKFTGAAWSSLVGGCESVGN